VSHLLDPGDTVHLVIQPIEVYRRRLSERGLNGCVTYYCGRCCHRQSALLELSGVTVLSTVKMPGRRWPGQYYFASDSAALLVGEVILVYSVALAVLQVRGAAGCVYHCAQSPCGPLRLGVTPFFVGFPFGDVDADGIPQSLGGSYQNVYTVDLSGLNISKILPGAFTDCFTFNETTAVQGIDLRNNPLGAIPDPAVFGSIGFLSLRNCSIGGITATELAGFHGRAVKFTSTFSGLVYSNFTQMYLDLSDNPITALPPMLFSESTVNQMVLSMSNHQLTALPPELFAGSAAERLQVAHSQSLHASVIFA